MTGRVNRYLAASMHEALTGLRCVTNAMATGSVRSGRSHILDAKRELRGALDSLVRAEAEADRELEAEEA